VLKIMLILFFISGIFFVASSAPVVTDVSIHPVSSSSGLLRALGIALIPVFFSYGGYQGTINFGADVHTAARTMPRAIIVAMSIVLVLYLTINYSYISVLGFDSVQSSPLVAASLAVRLLGPKGEVFTAIAIFISVLGFLNSAFLFNPRIWYAMAEERMLPAVFARINERTGVQEFSLTLFTILTLVMFFSLGTFEKLLSYVMFTDTITLATAAACLFVLRARQQNQHSGYSVPSVAIPTLFIATICCITLSVVMDDPVNAVVGTAVIAFGFVLYHVCKVFIFREQKG